MTVLIVDYGLCNLGSIFRAIEECGGRCKITSVPKEIVLGRQIVLPGVGSFAQAMRNMKNLGVDKAIGEALIEGKALFLGICLGMQLLCRRSGEAVDQAGLGVIDGEVVRFSNVGPERIPHMGWNEVDASVASPLFTGLTKGTDFYFAHSYHVLCPEDLVVGRTPYCGGFVSAISRENLHGVQFHPEKSQKAGFKLLRNFLAL